MSDGDLKNKNREMITTMMMMMVVKVVVAVTTAIWNIGQLSI